MHLSYTNQRIKCLEIINVLSDMLMNMIDLKSVVAYRFKGYYFLGR